MSSDIKEFYKGTHILITGATGLVGQLLVEKLLRVCTDIGGVYLIIRGKHGKTASERIASTFANVVFDRLREENPHYMKKIHVLDGDCSLLNFGLDEASRQVLIEKINVMFHCAACLNMEAKLRVAVETNIRSVSEMVDLCKQMPNLKAMMYVSTLYSYCIYKSIEEKFYEPPMQPDTTVNLVQELDSDTLSEITPKLIDKWPNTYCYSKAIAEQIVKNDINNIPVGVFRPSVVMSTYTEPVPGWTSNTNGPIGYLVGIGLGFLRVVYCNPRARLDMIPADFCVNALICSAWDTHIKFNSDKTESRIYNYGAGLLRSPSINKVIMYALDYENPFKNVMWAISVWNTNSKIVFNVLAVVLHKIPAYLLDTFLLLTRKKMRMTKMHQKMSKHGNVLSYFMCKEWSIKSENVYKLNKKLNEIDAKLFPFNMDMVNFRNLIPKVMAGIKLYILKETLENVEQEKLRYGRLLKFDKVLKLVIVFFMVVFIFKNFSQFLY